MDRETVGSHDNLPTPLRRLWLDNWDDEKEFARRTFKRLEFSFTVQTQVYGRHPWSENELKIDAVLVPLDTSEWYDEKPALGVEFKHTPLHTNDRTQHIRQSIDYSFTNWNGYGRLPIFMCAPGYGVLAPLDPAPAGPAENDWTFIVARMLGKFNIGELHYLADRGWSLVRHRDHVLWSENRGPEEAARTSVQPKIGSK